VCFLEGGDKYPGNVALADSAAALALPLLLLLHLFLPLSRPFVFEGIDNIEIKGSSLMPQRVVDEIVKSCLPPNPYRVDIGLMDKVREKIEKW
jgi:hypothetical protein